MKHLHRVKYGKKNTPKNMREYQINGQGAVGTVKEFQEFFPGEKFTFREKEHFMHGGMRTPQYYCTKCKHAHTVNKKIGQEHKKFALNYVR